MFILTSPKSESASPLFSMEFTDYGLSVRRKVFLELDTPKSREEALILLTSCYASSLKSMYLGATSRRPEHVEVRWAA